MSGSSKTTISKNIEELARSAKRNPSSQVAKSAASYAQENNVSLAEARRVVASAIAHDLAKKTAGASYAKSKPRQNGKD